MMKRPTSFQMNRKNMVNETRLERQKYEHIKLASNARESRNVKDMNLSLQGIQTRTLVAQPFQ